MSFGGPVVRHQSCIKYSLTEDREFDSPPKQYGRFIQILYLIIYIKNSRLIIYGS